MAINNSINRAAINNYTLVNTSPYNITLNDCFIGVDSDAVAGTIQLPDSGPQTGQWFIIKDIGGNAGANNITIQSVLGTTNIDGDPFVQLTNDYEWLAVFWNGTEYSIYSKAF